MSHSHCFQILKFVRNSDRDRDRQFHDMKTVLKRRFQENTFVQLNISQSLYLVSEIHRDWEKRVFGNTGRSNRQSGCMETIEEQHSFRKKQLQKDHSLHQESCVSSICLQAYVACRTLKFHQVVSFFVLPKGILVTLCKTVSRRCKTNSWRCKTDSQHCKTDSQHCKTNSRRCKTDGEHCHLEFLMETWNMSNCAEFSPDPHQTAGSWSLFQW